MNKIKLALICLSVSIAALNGIQAQTPKWATKVNNALRTITTFNSAGDSIGCATAIIIDNTGAALSPLNIFNNCSRAVATDLAGSTSEVELILGVNDLYNVAKIKIALQGKPKMGAVRFANSTAPAEKFHCMNFETRTEGIIEDISKSGGVDYYTLKITESAPEGSPVFNDKGELIALFQPATANEETTGYAISAAYINSLSIPTLGLSNRILNSIGIPKDIPTQRDDALAMLYLAQSSTSITASKMYQLLERFIERFPKDAEGYKLRSSYITSTITTPDSLPLAMQDIKQVNKLSKNKDEAHYHYSQCVVNYVVRQDSTAVLPKDWTFDYALALADKAIKANPLPLYYEQKANIYSLQQNYTAALEVYKHLNASPSLASYSSFYAASRILRILGDTTEQALLLMDSCVARLPQPINATTASYIYERAGMRIAADSLQGALDDYILYEQAAGTTLNALFYYQREQLARSLGNNDQALADITTALSQMPSDPTLLEEQSSILVSMARYVEAITSLNALLSKHPNRPYSLRLMGYALLQTDQQEEAKQALLKAKELGDETAAQLLTRYFSEE